MFSCEYCEIVQNSFIYRTPLVAASEKKSGHSNIDSNIQSTRGININNNAHRRSDVDGGASKGARFEFQTDLINTLLKLVFERVSSSSINVRNNILAVIEKLMSKLMSRNYFKV